MIGSVNSYGELNCKGGCCRVLTGNVTGCGSIDRVGDRVSVPFSCDVSAHQMSMN